MNSYRILIFLLGTFLFSQQFAYSSVEDDRTFYWYYIRLGKTLDEETGTNRIIIKRIENEVISGSFEEFVKAHQQGLKTGKIALGPFTEQSHAQNSQFLYKNAGKELKESSGTEDEQILNFYYVKPFAEDFDGVIGFERIPARVTNGTQEEFLALLGEGLGFDKLAIGPFKDYEMAEKSKFVYRKNGEGESGNANASQSKQALLAMAKKWKSLNLDIIKQADDKKTSKYTYRFNTKFPRKYFATDAFQSVTIKALYNEPVESQENSFTLQGENVIDNNPVISFDMGTVYINVLYFDMFPKIKIKGFTFESFIYNDSELIELEPINIIIK